MVEELSLGDAMDRLNERENYIIRLRFFEGKTQMEVAEEIHISQAPGLPSGKIRPKEYEKLSFCVDFGIDQQSH